MNDIKKSNTLFTKSVLLPLVLLLSFDIFYSALFNNAVIYQTDFEHVALANQYSSIIRSILLSVFAGDWIELGNAFESLRASIELFGISTSISYLPLSISYAIFGINDYTGIIFPLACSLLGCLFLYGTGTLLGGQKAGLVSAFIWSILPVEIYYSTIISTALPIFMFSQASIFLFLLLEHTEKNRNLWIALTVFCVVVLFFINPASLSILLFFTAYWGRKHIDRKTLIIGLMLFYLAFIIFISYNHHISDLPKAILHLYQSASQEGGWFIILALFLSSLVGFSYKKSPDLSVPLLWLATIYPVLTLISNNGIGIEKALLMFYAPVVTTIAIFLTNLITDEETKETIIIHTITLGALVWLASLEKDIDVLLKQQALFTPALIFPLSTIALGISFVGAVASSIFVTGVKTTWKNIATFLLLWMLGFCLIQHVNFSNRYARHIQSSSSEAYDFIANADISLPVYSDDQIMIDRIQYLSGFQIENLKHINEIPQSGKENGMDFGNAYIILSTSSGIKHEADWLPIKRIGKTWFNNFWIYRSLSDEKSQALISANQIEGNEQNGLLQEYYYNLYGANINAGNTCEGYAAWMNYAKYSDNIEYIPVIDNTCFRFEGSNIIDSSKWDHSPYSYGLLYTNTRQGTETITYHKKKYSDLNTIYQDVKLKPDTFYLLEISVISDDTQTMIVPYLIMGEDDFFLESGQYPEWTNFQMLFKTPASSEEELITHISPFLFEGSHISHFKDFQIVEIQSVK